MNRNQPLVISSQDFSGQGHNSDPTGEGHNPGYSGKHKELSPVHNTLNGDEDGFSDDDQYSPNRIKHDMMKKKPLAVINTLPLTPPNAHKDDYAGKKKKLTSKPIQPKKEEKEKEEKQEEEEDDSMSKVLLGVGGLLLGYLLMKK